MAVLFKMSDDLGFKFKTCMIATNMNLHKGSLAENKTAWLIFISQASCVR
jgi:hypothetical protein